jgi:hypothetical protein
LIVGSSTARNLIDDMGQGRNHLVFELRAW